MSAIKIQVTKLQVKKSVVAKPVEEVKAVEVEQKVTKARKSSAKVPISSSSASSTSAIEFVATSAAASVSTSPILKAKVPTASKIPTASKVQLSSDSEEEPEEKITAVMISESLKGLDYWELMKLAKLVVNELEKKGKLLKTTATKAKKEKKAGSMPKGQIPQQLVKPNAWVDFVFKYAMENGWEAFVMHQTKRNKETGEKEEEDIEMPSSMEHEGCYVFEDSVTDKTPQGKKFVKKDAMSLSKQLWSPKLNMGTHPELYQEFDTMYRGKQDESVEEENMSLVELEDEEEEEKVVEPVKIVKALKVTPVKVEKVEKKVPAAPIKAKKVEKKDEWTCPQDGCVYPWTYESNEYLRNFDNQVWERNADGEMGEWAGQYDPKDNIIDRTVIEPLEMDD